MIFIVDAEGDGGGCFTLSDLYAWQGFYNNGNSKGPVFVLDSNDRVDETATTTTGKWLLTADLFVTGGGIEWPTVYDTR